MKRMFLVSLRNEARPSVLAEVFAIANHAVFVTTD